MSKGKTGKQVNAVHCCMSCMLGVDICSRLTDVATTALPATPGGAFSAGKSAQTEIPLFSNESGNHKNNM